MAFTVHWQHKRVLTQRYIGVPCPIAHPARVYNSDFAVVLRRHSAPLPPAYAISNAQSPTRGYECFHGVKLGYWHSIQVQETRTVGKICYALITT